MSRAISTALCLTILQGCVSYDTKVLVPSITLSPDQINFSQTEPTTKAVDFGFEASVNESDSLFNVEVLPGVRVGNVEAGGPAAAAGLQAGDIVLSIEGVATNHPDAVAALQQQKPSTLGFQFRVRRGTTVFDTELLARALTPTSTPVEVYRADPIASRAGYRSVVLEVNGRSDMVAARVAEFYPKSPLVEAGIIIGDAIVGIDGVELNSAQDLVTRLIQDYPLGSEVMFSVLSGDQLKDVSVELWDPGRRISEVSFGPLLSYKSDLNTDSTQFTLLNLWLFSLYNYDQNQGEKSHSILGLIKYSSDMGELIEE